MDLLPPDVNEAKKYLAKIGDSRRSKLLQKLRADHDGLSVSSFLSAVQAAVEPPAYVTLSAREREELSRSINKLSAGVIELYRANGLDVHLIYKRGKSSTGFLSMRISVSPIRSASTPMRQCSSFQFQSCSSSCPNGPRGKF